MAAAGWRGGRPAQPITDNEARRFARGGLSLRADRAVLSFGGRVQTVVDMSGPIPRHHVRLVGLVVAFLDSDLLGTPLERGFAILVRDRIGVDQLLSKARFSEQECRYKSQMMPRSQGRLL